MLAIDTNIVVRFLKDDDPAQSARARALIDGHDVFIATTVLLQSEWVLRGGYGLSRARVIAALMRLAGLPHVTLEDPARIARALEWAAAGMDFADALHLASADGCDEFATFDRRLIKSAAGLASPPVRPPA